MRLFLTALAACLMIPAVQAQVVDPNVVEKERIKFDPKRDAQKDLDEAMAQAKKLNKRILVDIGGEWCGWCVLLDKFFIENQDARELMHKNYVVVKINWSPDNKNEKVLGSYPKIGSFPRLFVLDNDGKLIKDQDTGELETGPKHDKEKVMTFLAKYAKGA